MRILLCLLAMVPAPAFAEWVKLMEGGGVTYSIDPATIRKNGKFRKVWQLYNMNPPEDGVMSMRFLYEYDCERDRYRSIKQSVYSKPMARGRVIATDDTVSNWSSIASGTPAERGIDAVCAM